MNRNVDIVSILVALVAVVGIIIPSNAAAIGACTDSALPADPARKAFEVFDTDETTMMSMKVDSTQPDCSTLDDDTESDPAFAACYDVVDLPVSTIPSLFAEHQGETASGGVLGKVGEILGKSIVVQPIQPDPTEASVELTPEQRLRDAWKAAAQSLPRPEASCSAVAPDTCRTAPVVPTFSFPEVSSAAAAQNIWEASLREAPELPGIALLANSERVPASHDLDVPVPPPQ